MTKELKIKATEAYENYIRDCLAWQDDPADYISLIRMMEFKRKQNFEDVLKTTITFIKRHGEKLQELTDAELTAIHEGVLEKFTKLEEERNKPAQKRAASKKIATIKE